jgi:hypothetical protein
MDNQEFLQNVKSIDEANRLLEELKNLKKTIRKEKKEKKSKSSELAAQLKEFTDSVLKARDAYIEKGINCKVDVDKNGLIRKWNVKRSGNGSGTSSKQINIDELKSILKELPEVFSSKDIIRALEKSGIGERKLQPFLGNHIKSNNSPRILKEGGPLDKGPAVRYRLAK